MSKKYLGDEIDIHAGGEDLISRIMKMKLHSLRLQTENPLHIIGCTMPF